MKSPAKPDGESHAPTPAKSRKRPRRAELAAAVSLALARLVFGFAVIFATIASYAWWGSTGSRLGGLWKPAAVAALLWLGLRVTHGLMLRRIKHWHRDRVSGREMPE